MLNLNIVSMEVGIGSPWNHLENKVSYLLSLKYHEKRSHCDKRPLGNHPPNSTNDRYSPTCERRYLVCEKRLDTSSILLDNIERMIDICLTKDKNDNFLNIWMKMESFDSSLSHVNLLNFIYPLGNNLNYCRNIIRNNRDNSTNNNTPKDKYSNIHKCDSCPSGDMMFFSLIDEWIDDDSDKSCNYYHHKDRRDAIEEIQYGKDEKEKENLLYPN